ncbi:MAG: hypothetical protein R2857_07265 [Vampirovibrionales bacterium]
MIVGVRWAAHQLPVALWVGEQIIDLKDFDAAGFDDGLPTRRHCRPRAI